MDPYQIGQIFGAILLAAIPAAAFSFYWCAIKNQQKILAIIAAVTSSISGYFGGIILAIPTVVIFMIISKHLKKNVTSQASTSEIHQIEIPVLQEHTNQNEFETKKKKIPDRAA